jgi:hypothetical protein
MQTPAVTCEDTTGGTIRRLKGDWAIVVPRDVSRAAGVAAWERPATEVVRHAVLLIASYVRLTQRSRVFRTSL